MSQFVRLNFSAIQNIENDVGYEESAKGDGNHNDWKGIVNIRFFELKSQKGNNIYPYCQFQVAKKCNQCGYNSCLFANALGNENDEGNDDSTD